MAMKMKAGAILRHGADKITLAQLSYLVENEEAVQAIIDDIEARRSQHHQAELAARTRIDGAIAKELELEKREALLAAGLEDLEQRESALATATAEVKAAARLVSEATDEFQNEEIAL